MSFNSYVKRLKIGIYFYIYKRDRFVPNTERCDSEHHSK